MFNPSKGKKSINRRLRIRRPVGDSMYVYVTSVSMKPETRLQRYKLKDISNKGAFIRMSPTLVHKDMLLYLIFVIQLGSVTKLHRITATISRVVGDGIGVRFLTNGPKDP